MSAIDDVSYANQIPTNGLQTCLKPSTADFEQLSNRCKSLSDRQHRIIARLAKLEQQHRPITREQNDAEKILKSFENLQRRQARALSRLMKLEEGYGVLRTDGSGGQQQEKQQIEAAASPVQQRLAAELVSKGLRNHRFVRAPAEYYDRPLEFRRDVLGAASVDHLCKSIIMENTRVEEGEKDVIKYWLVIVQYSAQLHSDKLRQAVQAIHAEKGIKLSKSKVNMRLCDEEISDRLSGFEHNAVSPVGIATPLPILMSHRILELRPDFFWLGGGEVDLKLGISAKSFVSVYDPFVIDCTYDN